MFGDVDFISGGGPPTVGENVAMAECAPGKRREFGEKIAGLTCCLPAGFSLFYNGWSSVVKLKEAESSREVT